MGYAAAAHLGYGPPGLVEAWEAMTVDPAADRPLPMPEEDPFTTPAEEPVATSPQDMSEPEMEDGMGTAPIHEPDDMIAAAVASETEAADDESRI